ncbi:AAA domain-containing protein [Selenomonas ruminantium]|uniref:AAA domain-containing protein n=1 Tax=Selenomonas ruminantium TaxID=971 RepID=UPI0009B78DC1|nr:AAA domain-containing protein [Selenomonas ruminantium]
MSVIKMHDERINHKTESQSIIYNRVSSLFQFIQELNKLKQKTILNVKDYRWHLWCSDLPNDPENIKLFYQDRTSDDENVSVDDEQDNVLLKVHKEDFEPCPAPENILLDWLKDGWNDFRCDLEYYDEKVVMEIDPDTAEEVEKVISFDENTNRVCESKRWSVLREQWRENQKRIAGNRDVFDKIYSEYYALKRDSETEEVVVGNGIFCDARNTSVCHPILTRRVKLDFDAVSNTMYILDTDAEPEIYSDVLKILNGVNLQTINALQDELVEKDYHPLDRNDTPEFLKVLIRQLSSDSVYSNNGEPDGWKHNNRFLLYNNPCFILRKRQDGTIRAIEKINEAIGAGMEIPKTLIDLVSGGKADVSPADREYSIEEQLAMVGGESVDILLSKEANREQLEIAHRIEKYNAVLVQGPPGTGKTHTIANLLGHFIAQGKSVLVTSHTTKALDVLKDKIAPGLQSLCVSLLDDSNKDMERSVEGITSFMSHHSANSLKKEMETIGEERKSIIAGLAKVRKKIFMCIQKECESIIYQGESLTPTDAAKYVAFNQEKLDYIPGTVKAEAVLPLTFDELVELYRSNKIITDMDAAELSYDLPAPNELLGVTDFEELCRHYSEVEHHINSVSEAGFLSVDASTESQTIKFRLFGREFIIGYPAKEPIKALKEYCSKYGEILPWQQAVVVDGETGGGYRTRWERLIEQVEITNDLSAKMADIGLGMEVTFAEGILVDDLLAPLKEAKGYLDKGKLPFMFSVFHKACDKALKSVRVSGNVPSCSKDCEVAILTIELQQARRKCNNFWNELLVPHGVSEFQSLGPQPERAAVQYTHSVGKFLNWTATDYMDFSNLLKSAGLPEAEVCGITALDSAQTALSKRLTAIHESIPLCCDVCMDILNLTSYREQLEKLSQILVKDKRVNSNILQDIYRAVATKNTELYCDSLGRLVAVYDKYNVMFKRNEYLKRLQPYAPDWAEAISKHEGIHGSDVVRSDIMEAWKWRQLSMLIEDLTSTPLSEYQAESRRLSKAYREITAKYAEKSGWYHLLRKTEADMDMQQALQGWCLAVKRIGKGKGKRAPMFKVEARKKMEKCQEAVPAWIMPIHKVMENLNPEKNTFDIVIVDEASQADISSLAILFMGKKVIVVGDDKQVSPMAVGIDTDKTDNLRQMYLSSDIPNYKLYDSQTSIYDIAMTTYHPLMLREHFRCVPEIIGYSNWLSYDGKIMPLRSASSSNLLPAVVNYRVIDGKRDARRKINEPEAKAVVALMKACMEQPEYKGKSFGVISLLGIEQAKLIEKFITQDEEIDAQEREERRILCGDSSNFQGDERDVVFLSMVDSPSNPTEILTKRGDGVQDSTRKRYNVAASRARDQLWVVNSLDHNVNLQAGDIRKGLLEYALNPNNTEVQQTVVSAMADSEFEIQVAMKLKSRGYHIVQQWEVGAYRIDMVAVCGDKKVAIECDGERYHSSPAQVRNDMERQTILERIGWTFIRIRGSEYFRQPDKTIERVVEELEDLDIHPEVSEEVSIEAGRETELLKRVKHRAEILLQSESTVETSIVNKADSDAFLDHNPTDVGIELPVSTEVSGKANSVFEQPSLFSGVTMQPPKSLSGVAELLEQHNYQVIDKSQEMEVIWVITEKSAENELLQLLGEEYTVIWNKRGIISTENEPYFSIRSRDYGKRKK